jgi:hypothetical protein
MIYKIGTKNDIQYFLQQRPNFIDDHKSEI